eukprot:GHRQ01024672.1.p1 GENE.GHRQ01024672.1~~GHRQ01024672.1.p1  ORF type:complete len:164 (+),score=52.15 GHRQ01024672.1:1065-1556(+)
MAKLAEAALQRCQPCVHLRGEKAGLAIVWWLPNHCAPLILPPLPASCLLLRLFLQLVDLLRSYFEGALNESSVKRNFVLIYELLDETMDYGFPQLTEPAALKSFILQKGVRSELDAVSRAVHDDTLAASVMVAAENLSRGRREGGCWDWWLGGQEVQRLGGSL